MNKYTPMRSALFAPSNRPELIDKAVNTAADMVIIHNSGKVLGLVLSIALLASMTLTPAMRS